MSMLEVLVGEVVPSARLRRRGPHHSRWLEGGGFLIQRATVDRPEFPNGVMVIGATGPDGALQQHYFDSRGVHRLYEMTLEDGVWTLWRDGPDWRSGSSGEFSEDWNTISGPPRARRIARRAAAHDFDITLAAFSDRLPLGSGGLGGRVDHPARTEPVDAHAEGGAPRSLLERHRDVAALARALPVAARNLASSSPLSDTETPACGRYSMPSGVSAAMRTRSGVSSCRAVGFFSRRGKT